MDYKQLCLTLVRAETEEEVINILDEAGYWKDSRAWQFYGGNENNYSDIGNQQSTAEAALVEKIINSVDAVLMRECQRMKIDPQGKFAPKNLEDALNIFFKIYKGKLIHVGVQERNKLALNIGIVATGEKSNPSYVIYDKGEGQSPYKMPDTFLSLSKSNKLRIPFVQGKFNKGSTGTLQFCGKNNLQFILSKRDPEIAKYEEEDPTRSQWGFTIVRRADPVEGAKNSSFKYLAPNGNILSFESDTLNILPGDYPKAYLKPLMWGSFIKLYEYQLKKSLRSPIYFDLFNRLSLMLPNIALPIMLTERREGYSGHTHHAILNGLSVRLDEDKRQNVEEGFPNTDRITINSEDMEVSIYVFKKEQAQKYAPQEGVIFIINGQSHGFFPRSIFSRKSISLDYLEDSLLLLVDCTKLNTRTKEDLFMVSRDRLRDNDIKAQIEKNIEELLRNHEGLKLLNIKRYQEETLLKINSTSPVLNVLNKIINKNPSLLKLLTQGRYLTSLSSFMPVGFQDQFKGKKYPSYFRLKKYFPLESPKQCHINRKFRIFFETDVVNDYFDSNSRQDDVGEFSLTVGGKKVDQHSMNLWNGIGTLTVELPSISRIDDLFCYEAIINDRTQPDSFISKFYIKIIEPLKNSVGVPGQRIKAAGKYGNHRMKPRQFNPPEIITCKKTDGDKYKFKNDPSGALIAMNKPDGGYAFYVNLDNPYLLSEIKDIDQSKIQLTEIQYSNGLAIVALALLNESEIHKNENKEDENTLKTISLVTRALSPFFIPMIRGLADIMIMKD